MVCLTHADHKLEAFLDEARDDLSKAAELFSEEMATLRDGMLLGDITKHVAPDAIVPCCFRPSTKLTGDLQTLVKKCNVRDINYVRKWCLKTRASLAKGQYQQPTTPRER